MTIPTLESYLPEVVSFTQQLAKDCKSGVITGWEGFIWRVHSFYTPKMMDKIERLVPGWRVMASYADQQTLIHVTSVLSALYLLPEFQQATPEQQALMEWTVLFHDVAKIAQPGRHDYLHAFRSAAITGKALSGIGFPITPEYNEAIDDWFTLTHNAIIFEAKCAETIQDNHKLPMIMSGIAHLFGVGAGAGLVIKAVLLHLSIKNDPDYPVVAPLTEGEIKRFIDATLYPILKMMMLVDTDAWNIFDPANQKRQRQQTLIVFDHIRRLIGLQPG